MLHLDTERYAPNLGLNDQEDALILLDQTLLPNEETFIELRTAEEFYQAIYQLKVRGAPAIGIFAAFSCYLLACQITAPTFGPFFQDLQKINAYLNSARPTAVNLSWALFRMERVALTHSSTPLPQLLTLLKQEAINIQQEDIAMCRAIGENALTLLKDGDGVLTHCNAGPLATSKYGTSLAPLFLGHQQGMKFKVFSDETRPLLQGARLTSYELSKAGIDVTLICDSAANVVMKNGWIQACLVGCDRIAANGDIANKVGTNTLAILAKHYGIPFYVLGPTSTLDFSTKTGKNIEIELRDSEEIKTQFFEKPMALPEVKGYNPAFDVTDHENITAIITEKGICYPPFQESLGKLR